MSARHFSLAHLPDLSGKTAVVTGASAGLGRACAAQLLRCKIDCLYVVARSEDKFTDAKLEWTRALGLPDDALKQRTRFLRCDLSDLDSVKQAAQSLLDHLSRLDILMLNAAQPAVPDCTLSPQGVETLFAVNHLGHFVLTNLLLPIVEQTASEHGDARIVTTSSSLHLVCQELNFSHVTSPDPIKSPAAYDGCWRYGRSKLASLLFTKQLARLMQNKGVANVHVNCFFPGNFPTDAVDACKDLPGDLADAVFKGTSRLTVQTPEDAVATAMFLATNAEVASDDIQGEYFVPIGAEEKVSPLAKDKDLAKNLWYWSDHKATEALGKGWQEMYERNE
ncbi:uncharacterized protein K452DRAFT_244951 [Aplosporella prunicola CBS 121167]|uniref:Uncharacterized protein n=1 Tax=Aplosporella prunicola CBS 121167 TaxID=1176127 RepID=A0A6A6BM59_9PEZI|nr:uncharacterized protein K452DRAFT_244951 [Aplosporella prunicola CBS 121167]KAF2145202.1 hypothetical protein K452DRAFT_244951 [Aplosporella prunicola CBS 121167]